MTRLEDQRYSTLSRAFAFPEGTWASILGTPHGDLWKHSLTENLEQAWNCTRCSTKQTNKIETLKNDHVIHKSRQIVAEIPTDNIS